MLHIALKVATIIGSADIENCAYGGSLQENGRFVMHGSTDIQIDYQKRAVKEPYAAGEIKFRMSTGQRAGRCFYTDWIDTELGAGRHELSFYIIDELGFDEEPLQSERILVGNLQVFQQSTYIPAVPAVKMGAFLEPKTGRFQLGLQLVDGMMPGAIRIAWQARKEEELSDKEQNIAKAQSFYIANPPKYLRPGMKYTFNCRKSEDLSGIVSWRVVGEGAGSINKFGTYTAPMHQGVFEVQAILEGEELSASVYVIVRE